MAMELVRGRTFDVWRSMGVPLWKSVELLRDIARAIHHAHEQGILHRDLKPANIMVDSAGAPHVMDFGLAKNLRDDGAGLTSAHSVVGTPVYMSPEQAQGSRDIDRRSDVYSLGAMLYEMLTGQPPFRGKSAVETLLKTLGEPLRPPSAVVRPGQPAAIDRTIEAICLRALAKHRSDRHPTALDFAADLECWLTGRNSAPFPPAAGRFRKLLSAVSRWIRS
jgi:serine/threonine protein kinase